MRALLSAALAGFAVNHKLFIVNSHAKENNQSGLNDLLTRKELKNSSDPEKWRKCFLDMSHLQKEWELKPKIVKPNQQESQAQELELKMVQIVSRHGDRTPVQFFGETEEKRNAELEFWNNLLLEEVPEYKAWMELSSKEPDAKFTWSSFRKTDSLKGCVLKPWPDQKHQIVAGPESLLYDHRYREQYYGQLTKIGFQQTKQLGEKLRDIYVNRLGFLGNDHESELSCSSSNFRRTIFSLRSILEGLYPIEVRKSEIPIYVRFPITDEVMFPIKPWNIIAGRIRKAPQAAAYNFITKDIRSRMINDWNLKHISWTHIRDIVTCNLFYNRPLLNWMSDHILGRIFWHSCYKWNSEFSTVLGLRFAVGRYLDILINRAAIPKVLSGTRYPKFCMYSAHDNTIFFILRALGCDMSLDWPPYASFLIMETYADKEANYYVRFVYNGEVVDVFDVDNDNFPVDLSHVIDLKVRQGWCGEGTSRGLLTLKECRNLLEVFIPDQYDLEFPNPTEPKNL